jgi:hypothetical protein
MVSAKQVGRRRPAFRPQTCWPPGKLSLYKWVKIFSRACPAKCFGHDHRVFDAGADVHRAAAKRLLSQIRQLSQPPLLISCLQPASIPTMLYQLSELGSPKMVLRQLGQPMENRDDYLNVRKGLASHSVLRRVHFV